jgi:Tol biopolymer transport system component
MGVDGRGERRINPTHDWAYGGLWSPDGGSIAYSTFDLAAVVRIVVADANGSAPHVVGSFQGEREPPPTYLAWSRDGRAVAFDSSGNLMAADAAGRTTPRLIVHGANQPALSPDGRQLAYVARGGITIADADGSNARVLATGAFPEWSPDGRRIAYFAVTGTGSTSSTRTDRPTALSTRSGPFPSGSPAGGRSWTQPPRGGPTVPFA